MTMSEPPPGEVLTVGSTRPRRSLPRWSVVSLIVALALCAVGFVVDQRQRSESASAIEGALDRGKTAVLRGEREVSVVIAYSSPLLQVGPEPIRSELEALVLLQVAESLVAVNDAVAQLDAVPVWPWHTQVEQRKERALTELSEQAQSLSRATGQGLYVPSLD